MALKDWFTRQSGTPKALPPDQTDAVLSKPFPKRRKKKDKLAKQIDRIPPDKEDARERLERLAKWKTRADRAEKVRSDWETQYEVERCEKYFLGQQSGNGVRSTDVTLNHFLATVQVMKPNLLYGIPKFFVRPKPGRKEPAGELRASMGEGVLEHIAGQDQNLKRSGKLALLQAFFRIGCLKTVYDPKLEPNPRKGELIYATDEDGVAMKDPETGAPAVQKDPLTGEPMVEPDTVMTDEAYRFTYVDTRHLLLPDEGADPLRWTWMGERVLLPLAAAKTDQRFPLNLREQFESNASGNELQRGTYSHLKTVQDDELFQYTEVYDHIGKRLIIWADGQNFEDFLVDEPLPPGIEDNPYNLLVMGQPILGPTPCPWPMPFTKSWLEPQREYNIARQQIMEGGKRSARKVVYDDSTFPNVDEAVKFLQDPADMGAAKVNDVMKPPLVLPTPDINPAIYRNVPMLQQDWRIITGQTGARMSDPDAGTATEANFVERAANLRDADTQDLVTDWLSECGSKMLQLVKGTLTLGLWVKMRTYSDKDFLKYAERYLGIPQERMMLLLQSLPMLKPMLIARFGDDRFQMVTREELTFEADVTVAPGSMRPRNLDVERRNWLEFLRIIGQFPQLLMSPQLLRETAAKFETIDERMLDELHELGKAMMQQQNEVAGRNQGGEMNGGGAGSATAGAPDVGALLAGVQGAMG
jgi:hypothetical protein